MKVNWLHILFAFIAGYMVSGMMKQSPKGLVEGFTVFGNTCENLTSEGDCTLLDGKVRRGGLKGDYVCSWDKSAPPTEPFCKAKYKPLFDCGPGKYSTEDRRCRQCPARNWAWGSGGERADGKGKEGCKTVKSCGQGKYYNGTVCVSCPATPSPTYTWETRAHSQDQCKPLIECPAGQFDSGNGTDVATRCQPCPTNTYAAETGKRSTCVSCPEKGKRFTKARDGTDITGADSVDQCVCAPGTFPSSDDQRNGYPNKVAGGTCWPCPGSRGAAYKDTYSNDECTTCKSTGMDCGSRGCISNRRGSGTRRSDCEPTSAKDHR